MVSLHVNGDLSERLHGICVEHDAASLDVLAAIETAPSLGSGRGPLTRPAGSAIVIDRSSGPLFSSVAQWQSIRLLTGGL